MSDPRYKNVGDPTIRMIEELSELIHVICKADRFGWLNHHPDRPEVTNWELAKREYADIEEHWKELKGMFE